MDFLNVEEVTPPGLEPGTYGLENRCSILLSYGAILRGANIGCGDQRAKR